MPDTDPSADVATLLDRSGLTGAGYKSFAPAQAPPTPRSIAAPAALPAQRQAPPSPSQQSYAGAKPVLEAAGRLLSQAVEPGPSKRGAAAWQDLPSGHCLALTAVGGGVGASAILANAAAALARHGERVAIADEAPSLIPFYFGGRSFRLGPASFSPHRESGAGPVHLVTGSAKEFSDAWMLEGLAELQGDCDRILVRARDSMSPEAQAWTARAAAAVVLLTPEPASLLRLSRTFAASLRPVENEPHPLLLLNQFDPSSALHREIRSELSKRFGEHLLPFTIDRDEAFSRCLAAGGTVPELEPDSRAAGDIQTLVEWLRNYKFEPES